MKSKLRRTYGTINVSPNFADRLLESWSHVETPLLALRFPGAARPCAANGAIRTIVDRRTLGV